MWVFTTSGFVSVVAAQPGGALRVPAGEPHVMVRARDRRHLEALQRRHTALVGEVLELAGADYRFRLVVPRGVWVEVLADEAGQVTYPNFKGEAGRVHGHGSDYLAALHRCWGVMRALQDRQDPFGYRGDDG